MASPHPQLHRLPHVSARHTTVVAVLIGIVVALIAFFVVSYLTIDHGPPLDRTPDSIQPELPPPADLG